VNSKGGFRRWIPLAETIALLAALVLFVQVAVRSEADSPGFDLAPLAAGGKLVATGGRAHLYAHDPLHYNRTSDPVFDRAVRETGFPYGSTPFVYPPLVAWLMRPVAAVPFARVMAAWTWLSLLFLVLTIRLVFATYLPRANRPLSWAVVLAALTVFEPVRYGFWLGQTTSVIVLLVLLALWLARRGRPGAGVALGIAAFVKLTPALFALIWLWRGPRRAFAAFAATLLALGGLSLATMGPALQVEYLARLRHISGVALIAYNNHSLPAFLARLTVDPATPLASWFERPMPGWVAAATAAVALAMGAAAVMAARRIPVADDARWRPPLEGMAFLLILLAPSLAWTHYFVYLLPVAAIAAAAGGWRVAPFAAAALALCCRPLIPTQYTFRPADWQIISSPTLAALAFGALLLAVLVRAGVSNPWKGRGRKFPILGRSA
jgi:hypothetical protein